MKTTTHPDGTRTCRLCKEAKPLADFRLTSPRENGKRYYRSDCRLCENAYNADRVRATSWHYRRRYGITREDKARMFAEQGGRCAVCRTGAATDTDHDHATGQVRGLLCHGCNMGLGGFRDSPQRLWQAVEYLARVTLRDGVIVKVS